MFPLTLHKCFLWHYLATKDMTNVSSDTSQMFPLALPATKDMTNVSSDTPHKKIFEKLTKPHIVVYLTNIVFELYVSSGSLISYNLYIHTTAHKMKN